jgi:hypothetical protein
MAVSISKRPTKPKRASGKGETRYRAQVRVPGHRHVSKTFSRKKAALDWGRKEEDRLRSIPPGNARQRTVQEAIDRYRDERLPKLRSKKGQERHLTWWERRIGDLKLGEVTPTHIADTIRLLEGPIDPENPNSRQRSPGTINRYHSTIGAVFKQAQKKWHWMPSNPAHQVLRHEEAKGRVRWLNDEEREALLKTCKASKWTGL